MSYQKRYKATLVNQFKSVKATIPYEFVERQARGQHLEVTDFLTRFDLVAHYDDSPQLVYTFEPATEEKEKEE